MNTNKIKENRKITQYILIFQFHQCLKFNYCLTCDFLVSVICGNQSEQSVFSIRYYNNGRGFTMEQDDEMFLR